MLSEEGDLSSALSTTEAKSTTTKSDSSASSSKNITIEIQNSTRISGLAGRWKDKLASDGYSVGSVRTNRQGVLTHTKIIVESKDLGQDLKSYFKNPEYEVGSVDSSCKNLYNCWIRRRDLKYIHKYYYKISRKTSQERLRCFSLLYEGVTAKKRYLWSMK